MLAAPQSLSTKNVWETDRPGAGRSNDYNITFQWWIEINSWMVGWCLNRTPLKPPQHVCLHVFLSLHRGEGLFEHLQCLKGADELNIPQFTPLNFGKIRTSSTCPARINFDAASRRCDLERGKPALHSLLSQCWAPEAQFGSIQIQFPLKPKYAEAKINPWARLKQQEWPI